MYYFAGFLTACCSAVRDTVWTLAMLHEWCVHTHTHTHTFYLQVSWVKYNCESLHNFNWMVHGLKTTRHTELQKSAPCYLCNWIRNGSDTQGHCSLINVITVLDTGLGGPLVSQSVSQSASQPASQPVSQPTTCLTIHQPIPLPTYLPTYLPTCVSFH
jgi:hypothetical protein